MLMNFSTNEKYIIMRDLFPDISIKMNINDEWYICCPQRYIVGGKSGVMEGSYGTGKSPQEAIENDWDIFVTKLPLDKYILKEGTSSSGPSTRKYYKFSTYWKEIKESIVYS